MRAIWSGAISFGLVNIPVKLYSATDEHMLEFDLLHKKDLSNIRYAKVCRNEGEEVGKDEIVKGYEYEKGEYVIMDDEDFFKANARKTSTIDILDFAEEGEVDPIFYEKPYYLQPDKSSIKAFALLKESLARSKKVGIGTFVLRNREHTVLVKPFGDILLLNRLRYESDIRDSSELKLETVKVDEKEIQIALALIDQLSRGFNPKDYKDNYSEELKKIIEEKVSGRVPAVKGSPPEVTKVKDLMDTLKQSLEKERSKK